MSRNREVGLALVEGKALETIIQELGHVAEGVRCAQAVKALAQELKIDMPITEAVASVLFEQVAARDMIERLLSRNAKMESI